MASFTNSGSEVVERTLEEGIIRAPTLDLEMYEVTRCVQWIQRGGYRKVGLQFPDELLGDAAAVSRALTKLLGFVVYILGDTTYGSCCVDEVAAEHVGAEAVIHFGHTCLSPSKRLPVLYILTKIPVDISAVVSGLEGTIKDQTRGLIMIYDTRCHYAAPDVAAKLMVTFPHLVTSTLLLDEDCSFSTLTSEKVESNPEICKSGKNCIDRNHKIAAQCCSNRLTFSGRALCLPSGTHMKDYDFIYLGPSGPTVNCVLLRFSENTFYCVDPSDGSVKITSGVRSVMNRSAKIEMVKDAEIIGILVGTLGVADYHKVISRLKIISKAAGKRSYTFVVGKPNEPKLANISEVDVFVYVACPETSIVERNLDPVLYRKLVTPWEFEVALLSGKEWSLAFETDFRELLPGGSSYCEVTSEPRYEEASVSLLTNKTQTLGVRNGSQVALDDKTGAITFHDGQAIAALHIGGGGQALKSRSWQGLDPLLPATPTPSVVEGRSGIASIYEDEKS